MLLVNSVGRKLHQRQSVKSGKRQMEDNLSVVFAAAVLCTRCLSIQTLAITILLEHFVNQPAVT